MANARGGSTNGEAHRAAQRERILQAAEQLLVTHGVERSRLRDVSLAAGVSIGTVQHYFDTRDRLVAELFDWSSERRLETWLLAASTAGDPWTRLVSLLDASLAEPLLFRSRIWVEFCAMARDDELRAKLDRFYDAWRPPFREAIEDGIVAGIFHPIWPTEDIVDCSSSSAMGQRWRPRSGHPEWSRSISDGCCWRQRARLSG